MVSAAAGFLAFQQRRDSATRDDVVDPAPLADGAIDDLAAQSAAAIAARGRAPNDAALHRRYVDALDAAGRLHEAAAFVDAWLADRPDDQAFLSLGATLSERTGANDNALAYLSRLAASESGFDARFRLAKLEARAGRSPSARRTLTEVLEIDSDHQEARTLLVDLEMAANNYERAYASLEILLADQPDDLNLRAKAVECLVELGEYEEAIGQHEAASRLPESPSALCFHMGLAHLQQGEHQRAADRFADALVRNPFHAQSYSQLAMACRRLNHAKAAQQFAETFVSFQPLTDEWRRVSQAEGAGHLADAEMRRGTLYIQSGRYRQAGEAFERALIAEPQVLQTYEHLADYWRTVERPDYAETTIRKALAQGVGLPAVLQARLGRCLVEQHEFAEAEQAFRTALTADSSTADAALGLAELLIEHSPNPANLVDILGDLQNSESPDWRIAYWLGRSLLAQDQVDAAGAQFAKAVLLSQRKQAPPLAWAGVAMVRSGRFQAAGPLLVAAMQLDRLDPTPPRMLRDVFTQMNRADRATEARQRFEHIEAWKQERLRLRRALWSQSGSAVGAAYLALGKHYLQEQQGPKAQVCLMLAWQWDASLVEAYRLVAEHLTTPKDYFVRAYVLEAGMTHAPGDSWFAATLAQHYASAGLKPDLCRRIVENVVTAAPTAEHHAVAAEVLDHIGQRDDALRHAESAVQLQPDRPEFQSLLDRLGESTSTDPAPEP